MCRNFGITKGGKIRIPKEDCIRSETETVCNPLYQAELLNRAGTELNVVVGLCVGHDMMFNKHSTGLVTTLLVKDRMTCNNPAGPLYSGFFTEILKKYLSLWPLFFLLQVHGDRYEITKDHRYTELECIDQFKRKGHSDEISSSRSSFHNFNVSLASSSSIFSMAKPAWTTTYSPIFASTRDMFVFRSTPRKSTSA